MKINVNKIARKIEVDNRIPLRHYYRIADNLLRQASIHREENNLVDLFIILLRFSSLVSDAIPYHKDYQALPPKERTAYRKKLINVIDELEALKPEFDRLVEERNRAYDRLQLDQQDELASTSYYSGNSSLERPSVNRITYTGVDMNKPAGVSSQSLGKYDDNKHNQVSFPNSQIDKQFNKLSINLPLPKQETLSRHSILGPSGLRGQWLGPSAAVKVQYPSYTDLPSTEISGLDQAGQLGIQATTNDSSEGMVSTMESVLSLNDGRWSLPVDNAITIRRNEAREDPFHFVGIRQPPPPPVLAQVQHEFAPIPPSRVADPRPGAAKSSQDVMPGSNSYQHLHVPVNLMEDFLRLARKNTEKNLETCGVLAGSLKNKIFHITNLIIPKQESTSDSCQTLNEEEIFEVQDKLSLFPLGWIHTHPSQTCFMSSVDLHTHYSYQIMLPEAVAIVMAPTDEQSPHGIFHLSDPSGVSVIRNCQQRGFHPHEEPVDGNPIYEHCSHVYMNSKLRYEVIDLR